MSATESAGHPRLGSTPYSPAQLKTAAAALDLFAEHGVHGTSLQMIADAVGVTKAAVYFQFRTKEAIVAAAVEVELGRVEPALGSVEAAEGDPGALEALLRQVIDLAVGRRRVVGTLQYDPVIVRLLAEEAPFQAFTERLFRALLGGATDAASRMRVAMVTSAIGAALTHPLVADLDEDTLRSELLEQSLAFLRLGR